MPYLVNSQLVTEDVVRTQGAQLRRDPQFLQIPDEAERAKRLRAAAHFAAVEVTLFESAAAGDLRPIDPMAIERELQRQRAMGNGRTEDAEHKMRHLSSDYSDCSTVYEMTVNAPRPTPEEIEAFYKAQRTKLPWFGQFRVAHIVKHTPTKGRMRARPGPPSKRHSRSWKTRSVC
jgi:hypothetical protein